MGHPVVGGIEANTEILAFDFAQARMTAWWDGRSRGREQSRATARDNPPFAMKPQRMGHPYYRLNYIPSSVRMASVVDIMRESS